MFRATLVVCGLTAATAVAQPGGALAGGAATQAQGLALFKLANRAAELERAEDWPAATAVREQVLAIRLGLRGGKDWRTTDARLALEHCRRLPALTTDQRAKLRKSDDLVAQGEAAFERDNLAGVRAPAQEALDLRIAVLGNDQPLTINALEMLGLTLMSPLDARQGEQLFRRILASRIKLLGADHPHVGMALNNIAMVLTTAGDLNGAKDAGEQALAVLGTALPPSDILTMRARGVVIETLRALGQFESARQHAETNLADSRKVFGDENPITATSLSDVGLLSYYLGDLAKAREYNQRAIAIHRKITPMGSLPLILALNNLGLTEQKEEDMSGARQHFEEALTLARKLLPAGHQVEPLLLGNLGVTLNYLNDLEPARRCHEEVVATRRKTLSPDHPELACALTNLGLVLHSAGDFVTAKRCLEEVVAIRRKALAKDHPDTAQGLHNLGMTLLASGEVATARQCHEQALTIRRKALPAGHPDTARSLLGLGGALLESADLLASQGRLDEALPLFVRAYPIGHRDTAACLYNLGLTRLALGEVTAARRHLADADRVIRTVSDLSALAQPESVQIMFATGVRGYLDGLLSVPAAGAATTEADYAAVLATKGAVTVRRAAGRGSADTQDMESRRLADELRHLSGRLVGLMTAVSGDGLPAADAIALAERRDVVERELAARSAASRRRLATSADVRAAIPANTALVDLFEYVSVRPPTQGGERWRREPQVVAYVTRRGQASASRINLGPTAPIAAAVDRWRARYAVRGSRAAGPDPAAELKALVWDKLVPHLGNAKTVLVSPDGPLNGLPFAALPGNKPDTFLIEDGYAFATVPVPQLLPDLLTASATQPAPSLLAVGGVDYGTAPAAPAAAGPGRPAVGEFRPLANTLGETDSIASRFRERFPQGTAAGLAKRKATKAAFVELAPKHRFLHVATHGFFADESQPSALDPTRRAGGGGLALDRRVTGLHPGLLSGLTFAGVNADPAAGLLTALEAGDLDLRGVELAVLSACHTGQGRVAGGEGVLGLQRAFQVAGARTTVASLWAVDDAKTRDLMERFYQNLWDEDKPRSKLDALRKAQLSLLREAGPRNAVPADPAAAVRWSPYYWAGFVLSGDWR